MPWATAGGEDGHRYPSAWSAVPSDGKATGRSGHGQGLGGCEGASTAQSGTGTGVAVPQESQPRWAVVGPVLHC